MLAFVAVGAGGVRQLWVRALDIVSLRRLPSTDGARLPFWSPDSRAIGFFTDTELKRVDVLGGPVQTLAAATSLALGATWGAEGTIVFVPGLAAAAQRVGARGGAITEVLAPPEGILWLRQPQFLPDGRRFIVGGFRAGQSEGVLLASLDGGAPKPLPAGTPVGIYAAPGYLLSFEAGNLVARAFDAESGAIVGEPVGLSAAAPVPEPGAPLEGATVSASTNGVLAYHAASGRSELRWVDRAGADLGGAAPPALYGNLALSPDGRRIAFDRLGVDGQNVWLFDLQRQIETRLTTDTRANVKNVPVWSSDGARIAFAKSGEVGLDIFARAVTGAGTDEMLARLDALPIMFPSDWSADGHVVFYRNVGLHLDTWTAPAGGEPYALLASEFNERQAQFSPDGRWLAYVSDQSGRDEVYVTSFPSPGGIEQISAAGGNQPRWSRDGRELFYLAADGALTAVAVTADEAFAAGTSRRLFETPLDRNALRQTYAVTNDGRFLLQVPVARESSIRVVLGWQALLDP